MTNDANVWSTVVWPIHAIPNASRNSEVITPSLFPDGVVFEQANPAHVSVDALDPSESRLIDNAVEARRREFAAGRLCAHRALERLGIPSSPLLSGPDRAPLWPDNIRGSISHTHDFCGAAVARVGDIAGIGFDVEPAEDLPAEVWTRILTEGERVALGLSLRDSRGIRARLAFSLKEAFYKCHRSVGGGWLDFHDVELRMAGGEFVGLTTRTGLEAPVFGIEGRYVVTSCHVLTVFTARERAPKPELEESR